MRHCPNCGAELHSVGALCLNCGESLGHAWPPPPEGAGPPTPGPTPPHKIRRQVNSGAALGCLSGFLLWLGALSLINTVPFLIRLTLHWASLLTPGLAHGLALLVLSLGYLSLRAGSPWFARGWGYSIVLVAALSLGATMLCRA